MEWRIALRHAPGGAASAVFPASTAASKRVEAPRAGDDNPPEEADP